MLREVWAMPGMRWAKVVVPALLAGGIVFGVVNLLGPFLARHFDFLAVPRPPEQKIVASTEVTSSKTTEWEQEEPLPNGAVIASGPGPKVRQRRAWSVRTTLIGISYETPIDVNSTANIAVSVRQEQTDHRRSMDVSANAHQVSGNASGFRFNDDSESEPYAIRELEWPLVLRMDGLGLDWLVQEITIDSKAQLPATRHWSVMAKKARDYVLLFQVRDINRAAGDKGFSGMDTVNVSINGVGQSFKYGSDLSLPLSVWEYGMPARWFKMVSLLAAAITSVGMVRVFGSGWGSRLLSRIGTYRRAA
jgi:hypothetical protein